VENAKTLSDEVVGWVQTSGRALELRAARVLAQHGATVTTSFPYVDVHPPNAQREGDVLADFAYVGFNASRCLLRVVVECKHTPGKPWVGFYGETEGPSVPRLDSIAVFAHGSHVGIVEPVQEWTSRAPFGAPSASHIVTALGKDEQNPANNAVRQALSAAHSIKQRYLETQHDSASNGPRGWIILACVVTTSPLFACRLSEEGSIEVDQVDRIDVWGHGPDGKPNRVFVLTEGELEVFSTGLASLVDSQR
jgi:hypothetical protein